MVGEICGLFRGTNGRWVVGRNECLGSQQAGRYSAMPGQSEIVQAVPRWVIRRMSNYSARARLRSRRSPRALPWQSVRGCRERWAGPRRGLPIDPGPGRRRSARYRCPPARGPGAGAPRWCRGRGRHGSQGSGLSSTRVKSGGVVILAGEAPAVVGLKVGRNGVAALETEIVAHRRSTFRARIVFNSLLGVKRARALTALGVKQPFHYRGHTKE